MSQALETILKTADVQVRVMSLAPGDALAWHSHTEVTDTMVGLTGRMEVRLRTPDETVSLLPGERCTVPPGRVHAVANLATSPATYLLVQGVGVYDFLPAN